MATKRGKRLSSTEIRQTVAALAEDSAGVPPVEWPVEPLSATKRAQMAEMNASIRLLNELGVSAVHDVVPNPNNQVVIAIANAQNKLGYETWKRRAAYAKSMKPFRDFFLFGDKDAEKKTQEWVRAGGWEEKTLYEAAVAWRSFSVRTHADDSEIDLHRVAEVETDDDEHFLARFRAPLLAAIEEEEAAKIARMSTAPAVAVAAAAAAEESTLLLIDQDVALLLAMQVECDIAGQKLGRTPSGKRLRPPPRADLAALGWDEESCSFATPAPQPTSARRQQLRESARSSDPRYVYPTP
jgi:hypothetical protein